MGNVEAEQKVAVKVADLMVQLHKPGNPELAKKSEGLLNWYRDSVVQLADPLLAKIVYQYPGESGIKTTDAPNHDPLSEQMPPQTRHLVAILDKLI